METFIIATNNPKKLKELERILNPMGITAQTAKQAGVSLDDVEETGTTFEENAKLKARAAFKRTGKPCIADDSGLIVDALNGAPGVYSARYSGKDSTDKKNIDKLLLEMKDVPREKRTARFMCVICCILPSGREITVCGSCEGYIADKAIGSGGFGYDPVFLTKDGLSYGEMTSEEKDKISHRGNAIRKLKVELKKYISEDK